MNNCEVRPFIFVPTLFVKILFCGREKSILPSRQKKISWNCPPPDSGGRAVSDGSLDSAIFLFL